MTPKETAKELVDKYKEHIIETDDYFINSGAKECALIAVDELIKQEESNYNNGSFYQSNYWSEVKVEIEKL